MTLQTDFKFRWMEQLLESKLADTAKIVAMTLWTWTDDSGRNAFPGNQLISQRSGKSISTVKRQLAILCESGWITKMAVSSGGNKGKRADVYMLSFPASGFTQMTPDNTLTGFTQMTPDKASNGGQIRANGGHLDDPNGVHLDDPPTTIKNHLNNQAAVTTLPKLKRDRFGNFYNPEIPDWLRR